MLRKLNLYALTGIREFWLVDTDKKIVYTYQFENKIIVDNNAFFKSDFLKSVVFEGLEVPLEEVFI
ncbi:MAG: Prevent-host-death protein [Eubacterium sp.]|jgi:Uma2 family endonuclease|nr:Prevent-host-death protein [Eubacterium sp.]